MGGYVNGLSIRTCPNMTLRQRDYRRTRQIGEQLNSTLVVSVLPVTLRLAVGEPVSSALMSGERAAFLGDAERGYGSTSTDPPRINGEGSLDLLPESQAILHWARNSRMGVKSSVPAIAHARAYLSVLLYVRYLLMRRIDDLMRTKGFTRQRVTRKREMEREKEVVEGEVERHLDNGLKALLPSERIGENASELAVGEELGMVDEEVEEGVESLLWTKWTFGNDTLSGELTQTRDIYLSPSHCVRADRVAGSLYFERPYCVSKKTCLAGSSSQRWTCYYRLTPPRLLLSSPTHFSYILWNIPGRMVSRFFRPS
jgi:hypothetical protein